MTKLDKPIVATMLAGMCMFLSVYFTQPLLPLFVINSGAVDGRQSPVVRYSPTTGVLR